MATIKSYTDIEQSCKLAEILPIDTADMFYKAGNEEQPIVRLHSYGHTMSKEDVCAWSLTALLNIIPYSQLSKDKSCDGKVWWMVSAYPNNCRFDSYWHENPIDACYEMIIHLNELNLL